MYGYGLVDADEAAPSTNEPPVADAGADQTVSDADGNSVEAVTLDDAGSYDPDGSIVSYEWKEGETSLSNAKSFTHAFTLGTHTVTLTVTDDGGANSSDDVIVTVTEAPTNTMHVASIDMSTDSKTRGRNKFVWAVATVTIFDESNNPVGGATVSGQWSELTSDSDAGATDVNGEVALKSDRVKDASGTFKFTVDTVTKEGWKYTLEENVVDFGSIDA